jgi:hypothetical protein
MRIIHDHLEFSITTSLSSRRFLRGMPLRLFLMDIIMNLDSAKAISPIFAKRIAADMAQFFNPDLDLMSGDLLG